MIHEKNNFKKYKFPLSCINRFGERENQCSAD